MKLMRKPIGKIYRLRWEDCVKSDAGTVERNSHWREIAEDRWQNFCLVVWYSMVETKEKKNKRNKINFQLEDKNEKIIL